MLKNDKTSIVLFGITGDLAQKKILPALYDLYIHDRLAPDTEIVGFSRRPFSDEEIKQFVLSVLPTDADHRFLDKVSYVQGDFDSLDSYITLSKHLEGLDEKSGGCSNKLFYLSVPPTLYEMITTHISSSGLSIPCGGDSGWARILIEKPFGKNLETAQTLDESLGDLFKEEQIFRIDHYVAKDSIQEIINRRRDNEELSGKWNNEHISKVEINLFETAVVGSRGPSYEGVGAFSDVGQNHMLQMLALVAMEIPDDCTPAHIQKARADVLVRLVPADKDTAHITRGQYEGYLSEPGVAPDSLTETFFSLTAYVNTKRFKGVPFVLTSGKALSKDLTETKIYFKDGTIMEFPVPKSNSLQAYEKILLDCISGDQTMFISTPEILAQWAFVTPVVHMWQDMKPVNYPKGSNPEDIISN